MSKKSTFEGQHDDEEVLYVFRRHPIVMRKGLIAVLIGVLFGCIPILIWPLNVGYLLFTFVGGAIGGIYLFYEWIGWRFSMCILTDQRLIQITQKGLFNRSVVDIGINKIQSINYQIAGIEQTMLGFGTILVQTFVGDMVLDYIHHPAQVQGRLVKTIKELGVETLETPYDEE
jgi:uncharacterized membrane protein YdbT with pleckstrin-like domain